jgi:hypothetical protein
MRQWLAAAHTTLGTMAPAELGFVVSADGNPEPMRRPKQLHPV